MGVPVISSTLQELLPLSGPGTLDESALLAASDLITLLDKIRIRQEGIKEKVHKTVTTYNKEFFRIISQSNRTALDVESVSQELRLLLELLGQKVGDGPTRNFADCTSERSSGRKSVYLESSSFSDSLNRSQNLDTEKKISDAIENESDVSVKVPLDVEICLLASEVQRLKSRVQEREEALVVVETISILHGLLLATEKMFLDNELVKAARNMCILQQKLGILVGDTDIPRPVEVDDVRAFKLLQDAWSDRYNKFIGILEEAVSRKILLDDSRSELSVTFEAEHEPRKGGVGHGSVNLPAVFTAMDIMGVLDARLARLGDTVYKNILGPLLKNPQIIVSTIEHGDPADLPSSCVLKWPSSSQTEGPGTETVAVVYPKILQVIKFLHNQVFDNHKEWMGRFGRVFWPRLAEAIISGCLSKAVPNETSQLKDFHTIAELTAKFEKDLASQGLISNFDASRGDKLSTFTSDVEVHFALKKKKYVLAKARDLLMQSEYSLLRSSWESFNSREKERTDPDTDRSIFLLSDPCAISVLARSLLEIVHEALEDACLSTPITALELYHASRDVVLLYRAIIPVKLGSKLSSLSEVAALCHNDCLYMAHELLTFVYQYQEALPASLKELFTFVDLVPLFRQMAKEVLDQQITHLTADLMQILDRARGFRYTDDQYEVTQQALEEVLIKFQNIATSWKPVLPFNLFKKVAGGLINVVVWRIVCEVLSINDIAVQEAVQLQELLLLIQEKLPTVLAPPVVDELGDQETKDDVSPKEAVAELVPALRKLDSLINLLDMSLVTITQAWESGDLISRGFTASEVQKFIRAIFSETALREECVQRIGRHRS